MTPNIPILVAAANRYMYLVPYMISLLISVIGLWMMFEKAGEKGWKALVPGLNLYVMCKISGDGRNFVRIVIDAVILAVAIVIAALAAGAGEAFSAVDMIATIVAFVLVLAILIRMIMLNAKLAASFKLGVIWFIAMVLLPGIAYLIIGLSKGIEYIGPDAGPEDFENDEPEGSRFTNPYTSYKDF